MRDMDQKYNNDNNNNKLLTYFVKQIKADIEPLG